MAGSDVQAAFYYQNLVAAEYLLDLIEFGSQIRSITLENPNRAKYVDDVITEGADSNAFIQVKWSDDDTAAFTLHNLVTPDDSSVSLIAKLAHGFQRVSGEPANTEIILLSTKKAGTNRQPTKGFDRSLAEFLEEFHGPFIADLALADLTEVPSFPDYQAILGHLLSATQLANFAELARFLKSLRFRLGEPDRDALEIRVKAKLTRLGVESAQYSHLLDQVVRWSIERRLVHREDVLRALGLLDRFVDRIAHTFPVDRQFWVSTPLVFEALDSAISGGG